jgi:apolipoprotein N-acyltransferase
MDFVYISSKASDATSRGGPGSPDDEPRPLREAVPLCLASSMLYVLAFPGRIDVFWPLAFVSLVPLLFALRGATVRRALLLSLVFGLPTHVVGFRWLVPLLVEFSGFPTLVCLLLLVGFAVLQTSRFALWFGCATFVTRRSGRFLLPFVLAFAVTEALVPVAFEWRFAAALHRVPLLQQTADLWGATGVGVLLVLANTAIFDAIRARRAWARRTRLAIEGAAAAWVLSIGYGAWSLRRTDALVATAPVLKVGLLQANVPLTLHPSEEEATLARELAAHRALEDAGAELIVWSEGALPSAILLEGMDALFLERFGSGPRVPTFVGAIVVDADTNANAEGAIRARNAAIFADASRVVGRYDKQVLLPFSEYIPFGERFPQLYAWSPASGHFRAGTSRAPLRTRGHAYGVVICYEDVLPGLVRASVNEGAELLVNLTNDAWFGDSAEPHAHLALAKLRSIESRRYLVRATNTGISAIVDPVGRLITSGPSFVATTLLGDVRLLTERTVYVRIGEAPSFAALLGLFAAAAFRPKKRSPSFTPRHPDHPADDEAGDNEAKTPPTE